MAKKTKALSKSAKRLQHQRDVSNMLKPSWREEEVNAAFGDLVDIIIENLADNDPELLDDSSAVSFIGGLCVVGWNLAISSAIDPDAEKVILERISADLGDDAEVVRGIVKTALELKKEIAPEFDLLISEAEVLLKGEYLKVKAKFDWKTYYQTHTPPKPSSIIDDIIDKEAVTKAVEGVPPEQMSEAIKNALEVQFANYNDTPQEALGGKTPNQVHSEDKEASQ